MPCLNPTIGMMRRLGSGALKRVPLKTNGMIKKKLLRLPTLLRGRAWAVYDALPAVETDTYEHLKKALLDRLDPDTDEDRLSAREELACRRLC